MKSHTLRNVAITSCLIACILICWGTHVRLPSWNNIHFPNPWLHCDTPSKLLDEYTEFYDTAHLYVPSIYEPKIPQPSNSFLKAIVADAPYMPPLAKNFGTYIHPQSQDSYEDIDLSQHALTSNVTSLFSSFGQLPLEVPQQTKRLGCMSATNLQTTVKTIAILPFPTQDTSVPENAPWEHVWEGLAYIDPLNTFKNIVQTSSTGVENIDHAILVALEIQLALVPAGTYQVVVGP